MAKNVIILGAGASAPFGAPVMGDFLDVAQGLYATGVAGDSSKSFENVFRGISNLQAVHSKSEFDLVNLESIFTAFELAKILKRFPGREASEIDSLITDLKRLIVTTLERTIKFPVAHFTPLGHPTFVSFVKSLFERNDGVRPSVSILTFNYDIVLDMACLEAGVGVDYGLSKEPDCSEHLPLLKLHGSLNWGVEKESGIVVPWFLRNYWSHYHITSPGARTVNVPIGSNIFQYSGYTDNSKQIEELPILVPPSWNKADSHRAISDVWARAALELSEADSIYVIGYSLPQTDSFFRQLYAVGSVSPVLLKRFWVFNPDQSREEIFRSLLGPGARSRFSFFPLSVEQALGQVLKAIRAK